MIACLPPLPCLLLLEFLLGSSEVWLVFDEDSLMSLEIEKPGADTDIVVS